MEEVGQHLRADAHIIGYLLERWGGVGFLREFRLDAPVATQRFRLMAGQPQRMALRADVPADALPNPVGGVGAEARAALVIKLVSRADKPDVPFLDQVQQPKVLVAVLFRNADHKKKVALDHPSPRPTPCLGHGLEPGLCVALGQPLIGHAPRPHRLRYLLLLARRQDAELVDVLHIKRERVASRRWISRHFSHKIAFLIHLPRDGGRASRSACSDCWTLRATPASRACATAPCRMAASHSCWRNTWRVAGRMTSKRADTGQLVPTMSPWRRSRACGAASPSDQRRTQPRESTTAPGVGPHKKYWPPCSSQRWPDASMPFHSWQVSQPLLCTPRTTHHESIGCHPLPIPTRPFTSVTTRSSVSARHAMARV